MAVGRCRFGCLEPQRLTSYRDRGIKTRACLSPDYAKHVVEWGKARSGDLRLALQLIYTALFTAARLWKPLGSAPRCHFKPFSNLKVGVHDMCSGQQAVNLPEL